MTASLDMIRGRSNVVTLTNNSGGALVAGDVCVQDVSADEKVTTTTSAASVLKVFVAAESIGIGATGRFYESGYCPLVNVNASVTRGRFLFTHTVAKQAAENATYGAGAFGKILKSGTTPSAIIYSQTAQAGAGGGVSRSGSTTDGHLAVWNGADADSIKDGGAISSGAPSDAAYITTAANGSLSAEVAIPGLAGSADIAGAAGAGTSEEFDTASAIFSWSVSPSTIDYNTTIKSCMYAVTTASNSYVGTKAWTPGAGAIDARAKVGMGEETRTGQHQIGLYIANSDDSTFVQIHLIDLTTITTYAVRAFKHASSTDTQLGSNEGAFYANEMYLRITRDGSNNWAFYYSTNGLLWHCVTSGNALTFTIAKIGFFIFANSTNTDYYFVDWLRTSV